MLFLVDIQVDNEYKCKLISYNMNRVLPQPKRIRLRTFLSTVTNFILYGCEFFSARLR